MKRVKKPRWYSFDLDDYSAPSCTSFTKLYFGTEEDFKEVVGNIPDDGKSELKSIYERFVAGERKIIYNAGLVRTRFAKPAVLLREADKEYDLSLYRFCNAYGFYYFVQFAKAEGKIYLLKQGRSFYVVYKMTLTNPQYQDEITDKKHWYELGDMLWGYPGILKYNEQERTLSNVLGVVESKFDNENEAVKHFESLNEIEWHRFFEDVFGDG